MAWPAAFYDGTSSLSPDYSSKNASLLMKCLLTPAKYSILMYLLESSKSWKVTQLNDWTAASVIMMSSLLNAV